MAYEAWEPLVAGLFLLVAGGVHVLAPYQEARKAAMEEEGVTVAAEWEISATQVIGAVTALVGLWILLSMLWRW